MCYIARWNIDGFFHELQTNAVVLLQMSNRKNAMLIHRLTPFSRLLRHAGDTVEVFFPPPPQGVNTLLVRDLSLFIGEELLQLPIGLYVFANFKIILENATLFFRVVREGNDNSKVIFYCYTSPPPSKKNKIMIPP